MRHYWLIHCRIRFLRRKIIPLHDNISIIVLTNIGIFVFPPMALEGLPFRTEGRYHNVSSSVVDRQTGTVHRLGIDYNGTAPDNTTVAYDNLSARDRMVVDKVLSPATATAGPAPDWYFDVTSNSTEHNQSVLLVDSTEAVQYHRVQISWSHAKLKDLSHSSTVSASALLTQFEKQVVRCFTFLKTCSTAFRFPCFSYLKSNPWQ